jgi:RNA polymerase sigma factor (sigma-70 family)
VPSPVRPWDHARAHRALLGFLRACFPSLPDDVLDDAAQEAWRCWAERRDELRDQPEAWLKVVARRQVLATLRRGRSRPTCRIGPHEPTMLDFDALIEARLALDELARLSERQRRVLVCRMLGLSYREIQRQTNSTYTWVNRHATEGRAELRARLDID